MLKFVIFCRFGGIAQFDVYKKTSTISAYKALKTDVNVKLM